MGCLGDGEGAREDRDRRGRQPQNHRQCQENRVRPRRYVGLVQCPQVARERYRREHEEKEEELNRPEDRRGLRPLPHADLSDDDQDEATGQCGPNGGCRQLTVAHECPSFEHFWRHLIKA